jgi:hypothetical protein
MRLLQNEGGNAAIEFWPSLAGEPTLLKSVVDADQAAADEYLSGIKRASELAGIPLETQIVFGGSRLGYSCCGRIGSV